MSKRKRDANGKAIYDRPSDLKKTEGKDLGESAEQSMRKLRRREPTMSWLWIRCQDWDSASAPPVSSRSRSDHSLLPRGLPSRLRSRPAHYVWIRAKQRKWNPVKLSTRWREQGFAASIRRLRTRPLSLAPKDTKNILLRAMLPIQKQLLVFQSLEFRWKR